jgi:hypothetical protein
MDLKVGNFGHYREARQQEKKRSKRMLHGCYSKPGPVPWTNKSITEVRYSGP